VILDVEAWNTHLCSAGKFILNYNARIFLRLQFVPAFGMTRLAVKKGRGAPMK
jgi:hypothetical protein